MEEKVVSLSMSFLTSLGQNNHINIASPTRKMHLFDFVGANIILLNTDDVLYMMFFFWYKC